MTAIDILNRGHFVVVAGAASSFLWPKPKILSMNERRHWPVSIYHDLAMSLWTSGDVHFGQQLTLRSWTERDGDDIEYYSGRVAKARHSPANLASEYLQRTKTGLELLLQVRLVAKLELV